MPQDPQIFYYLDWLQTSLMQSAYSASVKAGEPLNPKLIKDSITVNFLNADGYRIGIALDLDMAKWPASARDDLEKGFVGVTAVPGVSVKRENDILRIHGDATTVPGVYEPGHISSMVSGTLDKVLRFNDALGIELLPQAINRLASHIPGASAASIAVNPAPEDENFAVRASLSASNPADPLWDDIMKAATVAQASPVGGKKPREWAAPFVFGENSITGPAKSLEKILDAVSRNRRLDSKIDPLIASSSEALGH